MPTEQFSAGDEFAPQAHLAISEDIFGCPSWGGDVTGIQWEEARAVAQHPTDHRMTPLGFIQPQMSLVPRLGNPTVEKQNHYKRRSTFEKEQTGLMEMKDLILGIKHVMGLANSRLNTAGEEISKPERGRDSYSHLTNG